MDLTPPPSPPAQGKRDGATLDSIRPPLPDPPVGPVSGADEDALQRRLSNQREQAGECRPAAYETPASDRPARTVQPLEIPSAIPGSTAPPLRLPPVQPGTTPAEQRSAIEALFADLDVISPAPEPVLAPGQSPLTLAQLQSIAMSHNPLIRQAVSDVEAARGNMIQAGAYPNPHVGYQSDDVNTGSTAGYQGAGISQTIVTGGKLRLAKASAEVDLRNAEVALHRARYDLATQVRSNYLGVLVARERIKVNDALTQFANRVYRLQAKRVSAGQAAAYEPLQLRVLAVQAQTQLIQSNQQYVAAWRKLAVTLNSPNMAPTLLAGRIDGPVPEIRYETAREQILRTHTDLVIAQNAVARAQYQLRLARITPVCPNIDTNTVIEHDYTTPPFGTVASLQVGVPLPIFDNNRGNIIAAEAALVRACSEYERARNDLFTNLADTFARYETNRQTAQQYHSSILVDQVRAYRGAYQRYQVDPDADFNDVVTSQQTLASTISTYIQLLGDEWQAVADLAGLMQIDDIFAMGQTR
ncbi:MAG: TolC family protein [Thermoguttaceae bacterium]|jgi:cobalt-zinc-cadmium efflux system outer membrane protein